MTHDDFKDWPPEFQAALKAYADHHGEGWEQELCADWATGKDERFPGHGAALRGIRNHPECAPVIYGRAEAGEGSGSATTTPAHSADSRGKTRGRPPATMTAPAAASATSAQPTRRTCNVPRNSGDKKLHIPRHG